MESPLLRLLISSRSVNKYGRRRQFISDWLISKKSSPLQPLGQMIRHLVESIYGMSSIKIAHSVPIR